MCPISAEGSVQPNLRFGSVRLLPNVFGVRSITRNGHVGRSLKNLLLSHPDRFLYISPKLPIIICISLLSHHHTADTLAHISPLHLQSLLFAPTSVISLVHKFYSHDASSQSVFLLFQKVCVSVDRLLTTIVFLQYLLKSLFD